MKSRLTAVRGMVGRLGGGTEQKRKEERLTVGDNSVVTAAGAGGGGGEAEVGERGINGDGRRSDLG